MGVSQAQNGSTSVTNSNTSLGIAATAAGKYECWVDCSPLQTGDLFVFWAEAKVLTGSTARVLAGSTQYVSYEAAQIAPDIVIADSLGTVDSVHSVQFFGLRVSGSNRTLDWSVRLVDGSLDVNVTQWNGTNVSATTAGVPNVNAVAVNNIATTSVTTVAANVGTTQPVQFTGTGSSATVKSDITNIATAAVNTASAQLGVNLVNIAGAAVNTSTAQLGVNVVNAGGTAWASGSITAAVIADNAIDRATFAADTGMQSIRSGTAQAGATGSITLDASASSVTDFYQNAWVYTTGGTGAGQERRITAYNGTTKVATVTPNWATTPGATTTFAIQPFGTVSASAGSVDANVVSWLGTSVTAATAGVPNVNAARINNVATTSVTAVSAIIGTSNAIDVTSGGCVGIDWSNVENSSFTVDLEQTRIRQVNMNVVGRVLGNTATPIQGVGCWSDVREWSGGIVKYAPDGVYSYPSVSIQYAGEEAISEEGAANFAAFYNNAGNLTTKIVDDVGTVAGVVSANVTAINGVTTSGVTTVSANIGTTQPINFQGTGSSAYVQSDLRTIEGTANAGAAGYVGVDWAAVTNATATVSLTNTTVANVTTTATVTTIDSPQAFDLTGNITGNLSGSVGSVADPVTVGTNQDKDGYNLAAGGLDLVIVEPAATPPINARQGFCVMLAGLAGTLSGAIPGVGSTIVVNGADSVTERIEATVDGAGNRTSVTLTVPS